MTLKSEARWSRLVTLNGRGRDADGQGDDRDQGEAGRLEEVAGREAEIVHGCFELASNQRGMALNGRKKYQVSGAKDQERGDRQRDVRS